MSERKVVDDLEDLILKLIDRLDDQDKKIQKLTEKLEERTVSEIHNHYHHHYAPVVEKKQPYPGVNPFPWTTLGGSAGGSAVQPNTIRPYYNICGSAGSVMIRG